MLCLFCLSKLLPAKFRRRALVTFALIGAAILTYAVCWGLILKGMEFKTQEATVQNDVLRIIFAVQNNSFGNIYLKDLDFCDANGDPVSKATQSLPVLIKHGSSEILDMLFELGQYESVLMKVQILGLEKSIKAKMNKGKRR